MNEEKTVDKMLTIINEKSIWHKIKTFFKGIFTKNIENSNQESNEEVTEIRENKQKNEFIETIRNIEDEEIKLLKLQQKFENGELKEEDLTKDQEKLLCALYDRQIEELKKSNELRKQKLFEFRKQMQKTSG